MLSCLGSSCTLFCSVINLYPQALYGLYSIWMASLCRGHSFFSLNEELLEVYSKCQNAAEIIEAQNGYLQSLADHDREHAARSSERQSNGNTYLDGLDLPPSSDSDYSSSSNGNEEDDDDKIAHQLETIRIS